MALTTAQALEAVEKLDRLLQRRRPMIDKYDAYYRGEHPLTFATPAFKAYWGSLFEEFADNWCPLVVNSTTERLGCIGVRVGEPTDGESDPIGADLWRVAMQNDFDAQTSAAFLDGLIAGRVYGLVWGNPDDESTPDVTFEHASQAIVTYVPGTRRREAALKRWDDDDTEFATLYTPEWVFKYSRRRSRLTAETQDPKLILPAGVGPKWEPRQPAGDRTWPLKNPMGVVPMVELPVKPRLVQPPESELSGVVPLQDYINLLWSHLATASDFVAMPQRVVLGAQAPKRPIFDDNGVKVGEEAVPLEKFAVDKVIWLTGEHAKIDAWPQADLAVYTNVIENVTGHIAAQSRTPQHYLIGKMANLSADALRAAEAGLTSKVRERIGSFTPGLREMFRLIALAQGDKDKAAVVASSGTVLWRDPETRSQGELVDALLKKRSINVADEILWEQMGMSPTEIARNRKLIAAQASDPTMARLIDTLDRVPGAPDGG